MDIYSYILYNYLYSFRAVRADLDFVIYYFQAAHRSYREAYFSKREKTETAQKEQS